MSATSNISIKLFKSEDGQQKPLNASVYRKTRELFFVAIHDTWRSLYRKNKQIDFGKGNVEEKGYAVASLLKDHMIGNITFEKVIETNCLSDSCLLDFIIPSIEIDIAKACLPYSQSKKPLLFIPFLIKGTFRNHIVCFAIDRENGQIEFYDPKGLTLQDSKGAALVNTHLKLPEVADTLGTIFFGGKVKLVENTVKHQYDIHNCGIYVLNFIIRRSEEKFEDVMKAVLPATQYRCQFISQILFKKGIGSLIESLREKSNAWKLWALFKFFRKIA